MSRDSLARLFEVSLKATVPDEPDIVPLIDACSAKSGVKFGDYQWWVKPFFPVHLDVNLRL